METSEKKGIPKNIIPFGAVLKGVIAGFVALFAAALIFAALINGEKLPVSAEFASSMCAAVIGFIFAAFFSARSAGGKRLLVGSASCSIMIFIMWCLGVSFDKTQFSLTYLIYIAIAAIVCSLIGSAAGAFAKKRKN